jgi:DNA-binding transcriptional ArsR family regulator
MSLSVISDQVEAATRVLKAAGEPSRLRILKVLEDGELCGCHLVELLGFAQPTVSRHLSILRAAGLVSERKDGRWTYYRLPRRAEFAGKILRAIHDLNDDDPTVLEDREQCRRFREIPVGEFCASVKKGCK